MSLGLIPDFYYDVQLYPLVNPVPAQLGLIMVDSNPLGCVGCMPQAGPVGRVMVDAETSSASALGFSEGGIGFLGLVLGAAVGVGAGVLMLRRRRR